MKKSDVQKLPAGFYRVLWKSGGYSFAAVGITNDGGRWLAPLNWVAPTCDQKQWRVVERVELVASLCDTIEGDES